MIYFTLEQTIDTINNNTEYHYKSILFNLFIFLKNNRLYLKVVWNNKKETVKEIKQLLDIKRINDIIGYIIKTK